MLLDSETMALYKTLNNNTPSSRRTSAYGFPFHGNTPLQSSMNSHLRLSAKKMRLDSADSIISDISRQTTITGDLDDDDDTIIHRDFLKPTTTPSLSSKNNAGAETYFAFNEKDENGHTLRDEDLERDSNGSDSEELNLHYTPMDVSHPSPLSGNSLNPPTRSSRASSKQTNLYSLDDALKTLQFGKYHYVLITVISLIYFAMGLQAKITNVLSTLIENNSFVFTIPTNAEPVLYISFSSGGIIGIYLCALADKFGRKRIITISCISLVLFTILQILAYNFVMLAFARLFIGCSCGVAMISCLSLAIEYVPNHTRFRVMYFLFMIGIISSGIGSLIGYIVWAVSTSTDASHYIDLRHWRLLLIVISIPS